MDTDYTSSPEGRLWHAVLATYYIDACKAGSSEYKWRQIMRQAKSERTKFICSLIALDHDFFIENLRRVRGNRKSIEHILMGKVWWLR